MRHSQSVGKIHKILLDDSVRTGVRTSAVTQYYKCMSIGILLSEVFPPDSCDIVTDKPGCVVADSQCHIAHIPCHVIDAVRNNLTIGECRKIVVKGFEPTRDDWGMVQQRYMLVSARGAHTIIR